MPDETPTLRELRENAQKAVLDQLIKQASGGGSSGATAALQLAEAFAWLNSPAQSHGGNAG